MSKEAIVSLLNKLSVDAIQNMTTKPNKLRLWIEDGRVTGFVNENNRKLHKEEIPTQTGNQGGDK